MTVQQSVLNLATAICIEHGLTYNSVFKMRECNKTIRMSRNPRATRARDHVLHVIRWSTGWSYPEIAALWGLDHTTVIEAVNRHEAILNGERV